MTETVDNGAAKASIMPSRKDSYTPGSEVQSSLHEIRIQLATDSSELGRRLLRFLLPMQQTRR